MKHYDESRRIRDLIAPFGSKTPQSRKHKRKPVVTSRGGSGLPISSQEQRLEMSGLRPTIARTGVLGTLEKAAPSCLDASQIYHLLSTQFDSLAQGSVYRALNDLWTAGLLVRTAGARGRAFYAIKPQASKDQYVTLRCHCGARLVFIDDPVLHKHLQSLAFQEGFALVEEPVFIVTTTCSKCRHFPA